MVLQTPMYYYFLETTISFVSRNIQKLFRRCFVKNVLLEISQNFAKMCQSLFFKKVAGFRRFHKNFVKFLRRPFF